MISLRSPGTLRELCGRFGSLLSAGPIQIRSSTLATSATAELPSATRQAKPTSLLEDDDDGFDDVEFTKPIEEDIPSASSSHAPPPQSLSSLQKGPRLDPLPKPYLAHRERMKQKFPQGWNPPKRISREAMDQVRALHKMDPQRHSTEMLAGQFRISPEAVRRILRSRWTPEEGRLGELEAKEAKRKEASLEYYRTLREARREAAEKRKRKMERGGTPQSADEQQFFFR